MKRYIILVLILSITHHNLFSNGQEAPAATKNENKIKLLEQRIENLSNKVLEEHHERLRNENAAWRNAEEREKAKHLAETRQADLVAIKLELEAIKRKLGQTTAERDNLRNTMHTKIADINASYAPAVLLKRVQTLGETLTQKEAQHKEAFAQQAAQYEQRLAQKEAQHKQAFAEQEAQHKEAFAEQELRNRTILTVAAAVVVGLGGALVYSQAPNIAHLYHSVMSAMKNNMKISVPAQLINQ